MRSHSRLLLSLALLIGAVLTACQETLPAPTPPTPPPAPSPTPPPPPPPTPPAPTPPSPPPATAGFSLAVGSSAWSINQGDAQDVTVTVTRTGGFAQPVTLTLENLPAGVSSSPVTVAAGASSATLRVSADATATVSPSSTAPYTVQLVATAGTLRQTLPLTVSVLAADPSRPDLFIKRIEWGQSVLKSDLRLVAGKPAVLRAFVNADRAGIAGVVVRATATVNGATLGTVDLTAPATVPITDASSDLTGNYWMVIPKDWIKPGLELRLDVDPGNTVAERNKGNNTQTLKPDVGPGNRLELTLVPVVVNGVTPPAPDTAAARANLMALWPLADVDVKVRAAYTATKTDLSSILGELDALRDADNSSRYYYGYFNVGGGIGFIGWPVGAGSISAKVLAHELGHNLGQYHAPCGNPSGVDAKYPYAGGSIGSWGFNPATNKLVDPAVAKDVMGYCGNNWVSDYMYRRVQTFLERTAAPASANTAPTDLLLVRGSIENGQVTLEPLQRITGVPRVTPGLYTLRLQTATGVQDVSFDTNTVNHEDGSERAFEQQSFSFTVRDPGAVQALSIAGANLTTLERRLEPRVTTQAVSSPDLRVERAGGTVTVRWNAARYPTAGVAHIAADGTRTTLALGLTGGQAQLETGGLNGGTLEVSVSDGLNGVKQRF